MSHILKSVNFTVTKNKGRGGGRGGRGGGRDRRPDPKKWDEETGTFVGGGGKCYYSYGKV